MARRPRLQLAGYPYHVIQRGHNRAPCFVGDRNYQLYLGLLDEFRQLFDCSIHAYVLMPNHVHLLVSPASPENLTAMMKHVSQRYVQHFNRTYSKTGSLWEGRFRSCPVDSEAYLLRCQRYIELNPVRARLAARPEDYRWSSFRVNAGMITDGMIVPHSVYSRVAGSDTERKRWYREFVSTEPNEQELMAIRKSFSRQLPLGTDPGACPRGLSPV